MSDKMNEEEKEQIEAFTKDAKAFLEARRQVLDFLDGLHVDFLNGKDISEKLESFFLGVSSEIRRMATQAITISEEEFNDLRDKSELSKEEKEEIDKFRDTYQILSKPIAKFLIERENNVINHWTTIRPKGYLDYSRNMAQIELKIYSFDKQTYHSKEDIDDIYEMTGTLQEIILDNLKMLKEKDVHFDHDLISNLNEVGSKINEHSRDILEILGSFEKKEQQGEEETEKALQPES